MKKGLKTRKFSRTSNQRKQLFRNLIRSLVLEGRIKTTEAKAKAVKPQAEKLVTIAKDQSLLSFRKLVSDTGDVQTAKKFGELGKLFEKRNGGYLRILRLEEASSDNRPMVRLEWVEQLVAATVVPAAEVVPAETKAIKEPKRVAKSADTLSTLKKPTKKSVKK